MSEQLQHVEPDGKDPLEVLKWMQMQTDKMSMRFALLVMDQSLTQEQVAQANTRLENFREDLLAMVNELLGCGMNREERILAMAKIMVNARRASEDVGTLIAASLRAASEKLGSEEALVRGRPGSWEADIVRRMATAGGSGNKERIEELAALFVVMGRAIEDGGDVLSQAMGKAVDELKGLDTFARGSRWYHDLINIGCQYSQYDYPL